MRRIYREKTYICGDYKEVYIYPCYNDTAPGLRRRRQKFRPTAEAQKKYNQKVSENKLVRLLNANFTADDLSFDLTYSEENHPANDEQAERDYQNFIRRLKRYRKQHGLPPLKYIAAIAKGAKKGRYHHHLVINGGIDSKNLAALWGLGYCTIKPLQFNETGLIAKGLYMARQSEHSAFMEDRPTKKKYFYSRNLIQPKPTTRDGRISHALAAELSQTADRALFAKLFDGYHLAEVNSYYNDVYDGYYLTVRLYRADATFNGTIRKRKQNIRNCRKNI